jgi:hypothetical protein
VKKDRLAIIVLVAALAALGATTAWAAVTATSGSKTTNNYYGSMMRSGGMIMGARGTMMGLAPVAGERQVTGLTDAKQLAQRFADRLGLKAAEVLQFERNYYVKLVDSKGHGATEVLVDPETGIVTIEYGPAMMWNTRYGMHDGAVNLMGSSMGMMRRAGMMGGRTISPTSETRTESAARVIAQRWLSASRPGVKVESGGDAFPGYYTFEVLKQGKIDGMLSVNAGTGAVMYHWWHGAFVGELR